MKACRVLACLGTVLAVLWLAFGALVLPFSLWKGLATVCIVLVGLMWGVVAWGFAGG